MFFYIHSGVSFRNTKVKNIAGYLLIMKPPAVSKNCIILKHFLQNQSGNRFSTANQLKFELILI